MDYREQTTWTIRIEASAEFDEDYDGELDGYAWRERFFQIQARVLAAVFRELQATTGWRVRPANRGMSATDEVLIRMDLDTEAAEP